MREWDESVDVGRATDSAGIGGCRGCGRHGEHVASPVRFMMGLLRWFMLLVVARGRFSNGSLLGDVDAGITRRICDLVRDWATLK